MKHPEPLPRITARPDGNLKGYDNTGRHLKEGDGLRVGI